MLGTPVSVILPLVVVPLVLVPDKLVAICIKFPKEINPSGKPVADVFTLDTFVTFPVLVLVLILVAIAHLHYYYYYWPTHPKLRVLN